MSVIIIIIIIIIINFSCCFNNLQHYNNNLTRHSDVYIVCGQPVCHYVAPLIGGTNTNVTWS